VRLRYELASVVNHHGSTISGGHYTAFCKQRLGWFCFNDTLGALLQRARVQPPPTSPPPAVSSVTWEDVAASQACVRCTRARS
jgi:hypothetical protein